jgi:hypothetical protein
MRHRGRQIPGILRRALTPGGRSGLLRMTNLKDLYAALKGRSSTMRKASIAGRLLFCRTTILFIERNRCARATLHPYCCTVTDVFTAGELLTVVARWAKKLWS